MTNESYSSYLIGIIYHNKIFMEPTLLATAAAQYFFIKATDGAIQKLGEDFTTRLYRLKWLIEQWLKNNSKQKEATQEPQILEAELIEDFTKNQNPSFKEELESLVKQLQDIDQAKSTNIIINASQRTQHGSSMAMGSVEGSQVSGGNQQNLFR